MAWEFGSCPKSPINSGPYTTLAWSTLAAVPPFLALVLLASPTVVVVDVSASDAIYEDVSRGLANALVEALKTAGFDASRIDENELPEDGCRAGPCLENVAKTHHAQAVVLLDALEEGALTKVSLLGLGGRDGRPLAGVRYTLDRRAKHKVLKFIAQLQKAFAPRDAGH